MANFVATLISIFITLAGFAGFIGGILLIFAGEWSLFFSLLFIGIVAPFFMAFVMLPSAIFALPAVSLLNKGYSFLSSIFGWISSLYLGAVFAAWSAYVFIYVMNTTGTFWGGVLASFGTAISPIAYMASKEPVNDEYDSLNTTLTMLTAQISLASMIVLALIFGGNLIDIGIFYFKVFAVLSAMTTLLMSSLMRAE